MSLNADLDQTVSVVGSDNHYSLVLAPPTTPQQRVGSFLDVVRPRVHDDALSHWIMDGESLDQRAALASYEESASGFSHQVVAFSRPAWELTDGCSSQPYTEETFGGANSGDGVDTVGTTEWPDGYSAGQASGLLWEGNDTVDGDWLFPQPTHWMHRLASSGSVRVFYPMYDGNGDQDLRSVYTPVGVIRWLNDPGLIGPDFAKPGAKAYGRPLPVEGLTGMNSAASLCRLSSTTAGKQLLTDFRGNYFYALPLGSLLEARPTHRPVLWGLPDYVYYRFRVQGSFGSNVWYTSVAVQLRLRFYTPLSSTFEDTYSLGTVSLTLDECGTVDYFHDAGQVALPDDDEIPDDADMVEVQLQVVYDGNPTGVWVSNSSSLFIPQCPHHMFVGHASPWSAGVIPGIVRNLDTYSAGVVDGLTIHDTEH